MAIEVRFIRWCDICADDDRKMEAEQLSLPGGGNMKLDVCAEHRQPFDAVAELIKAYGYRESPASAKARRAQAQPRAAQSTAGKPRATNTDITDPDSVVCPECSQPYSTKSGMTNFVGHLLAVHGIKMTAPEARQRGQAARAQALEEQLRAAASG